MQDELKREVYNIMLTYPTKSDYTIAEEFNLTRSTVYRARMSLIHSIDYELAKKVAGKFLADFQMATDYFKKQIERLEELKIQEKTVHHSTKDGGAFTTQEKLDPLEILAIEKQQTELWKNILFVARQGEAVEVMRLIQNGRIPAISN